MMSQRALQILLIESQPRYGHSIQRLLSDLPGRPSEVSWIDRLPQGIDRSVLQRFELIFYSLSRCDDLELATLSRLRSHTETAPIIALTPLPTAEFEEKLCAAGATVSLEKRSLDADQLSRLIGEILERGEKRKSASRFSPDSLSGQPRNFRRESPSLEFQSAVIELSRLALLGTDLERILGRAADLLVETLALESCRILELHEGSFRVRMQRNWPQSEVVSSFGTPAAEVGIPVDSKQALAAGSVFSQTTLPVHAGIQPWGILEAGRSGTQGISAAEIHVLNLVRELLSEAIESHRLRLHSQQVISRLQAEAEAGLLASITLDLEGKVVNWNRAAGRLFGWNALETLGQPLPIFPGATSQESRLIVERLLGEGGETVERLQLLKADGSTFESDIWLAGLADESGKVQGLLLQLPALESTLSSGPPRKPEEARRETPVPGEEVMRTLGRMAGGIAHELNNLFTIFRCSGKFLAGPLSQDEQLSKHVDAILKTMDRCTSLTDRLQALAGQSILNPQLCDLNQLTLKNQARLRGLLGEGVALSLELAPKLAAVAVDRERMVQLIHEMAVNSRAAMPRGGKLAVRTSNRDATQLPETSILFGIGGRVSVVEFQDNGTGIEPELLNRIFDPYFSTRPGSKGLGLSLGLAFVRQSGGDILVESRPGEGTRFRICLPAAPSRAAQAKPEPEAESTRPLKAVEPESKRTFRKVLLVENNDSVRELVREILSDHGYQVLESTDAAKLVQDAETGRLHADLLICEVEMPGMSGYDLSRRLSRFLPEIKTLYLADFPETEVGRSEFLGAESPFLKKPFKAAELLQKVSQLLKWPCR